jgi:hypothetical protein
MKNTTITRLILIILATCSAFGADDKKLTVEPAPKTEGVYVLTNEQLRSSGYSTLLNTDNPLSQITITMPIYNKITVAGWIDLRGKKGERSQSITVADQGAFTAADTVIIVQHEPVVAKLAGGTWAITFRDAKVAPEISQLKN